jgi:hypothetical protein
VRCGIWLKAGNASQCSEAHVAVRAEMDSEFPVSHCSARGTGFHRPQPEPGCQTAAAVNFKLGF